MQELFEEYGLTPHEVKVYRALLEHGASLAGEITKRTGIHRRNVYDCLERLIQKGLIGYIKENNRKRYRVHNPRVILEQLDKQRKEWEQLMPTLIQQYEQSPQEQETLFFRGQSGVRQVLLDQIAVGEEILVNATSVGVKDVLSHFFPKYQLLREENGIPTRMLFDESYNDPKSREKIAELPLCEARYMREVNTSPMSQYIYGDNVAIVVWSETPIAILIRSPEVSQGFRDSFEALWKAADE